MFVCMHIEMGVGKGDGCACNNSLTTFPRADERIEYTMATTTTTIPPLLMVMMLMLMSMLMLMQMMMMMTSMFRHVA